MTRTALYRHFDADGRLLYVGISDCLSARDKQHAATAHWHSDVERTETEWCLSREHALALESVAIKFESPLHNRMLARPAKGESVTVRDVIGKWARRSDLAFDVGCKPIVVHRWAERGRIPAKYHAAIISAAAMRGMDLTHRDLAVANAEAAA